MLGFCVTAVSAPSEAMTYLATMPVFDLVFTEFVGRGPITGAQLVRHVTAKWPQIKVLVAIVGLNTRFDLPATVRILSKPYSNSELEAAVYRALKLAP